jgi:phytoene dehydrogenase-like protein
LWYEGVPVDRGFQTIFTGYPRTREFIRDIGIPDRDLRAFAPGAVYVDGADVRQIGLVGGLKPRVAGLGVEDLVTAARLVAACRSNTPDSWLATGGETTEEFLQDAGFSGGFIDQVIRPLFGSITLDRSLSADSGYFRFLVSVMARGRAVIPSDGLGMLAEWAAAAIRVAGGSIELNSRVERLETGPDGRVIGVRLAEGRTVFGRTVVLATSAPATGALLRDVDPRAADRLPINWASSINLAYALDLPLYRGRTLLLNSSPVTGAPRVDLLCQTSNVNRPGDTEGPHIVLATLITTDGLDSDDADAHAAVSRFVSEAAPRFNWSRHAVAISAYRHKHALPRPVPSVRFTWPGTRTAAPNLVLAGDALEHPSIEGAITSGAEAAVAVLGILTSGP